MNLLIGIAYIIAGFGILLHSAQHWESPSRRAKFWFLGAGMMQLGVWISLLHLLPHLAAEYDWMRIAGHFSLIIFAGLHLTCIYYSRIRTWI